MHNQPPNYATGQPTTYATGQPTTYTTGPTTYTSSNGGYTTTVRTTTTSSSSGYPQNWSAYRGQDFSNFSIPNYGVTMSMIDENAQRLFNDYDKDRSGSLNLQELYGLLEEFARTSGLPPFDYNAVQALMARFDCDGSGTISFPEFEMLLMSLGGRPFTQSMIQQYRTLPMGTNWRTHFNYY